MKGLMMISINLRNALVIKFITNIQNSFCYAINLKYIHIAYIWGCLKTMSYSVFGDLGSKRWQMRCTVNNTLSHHHILKDILLRSLKWADKWYSGILFKLGVTHFFHQLMKSYFSKHQCDCHD